MLKKIVAILNASQSITIEGSTLFCHYIIVDTTFLEVLYDENYIENTNLDEFSTGNTITLEFSIPLLTRLGFFEKKQNFLDKNLYQTPQQDCYIFETKKYISEDSGFEKSYKTVVKLIHSISSIAKYIYDEAEIRNSLIIREDKSLLLPFKYNLNDINSLDDAKIDLINHFIKLLESQTFEDKKMSF